MSINILPRPLAFSWWWVWYPIEALEYVILIYTQMVIAFQIYKL
jgi:hypothetical protein